MARATKRPPADPRNLRFICDPPLSWSCLPADRHDPRQRGRGGRVREGRRRVSTADHATWAFPGALARRGQPAGASPDPAGGIAEGGAATVAQVLISQLTEGIAPSPYDGAAGATWSWATISWRASTSPPTTCRSQRSPHPLLRSPRRSESGGPREPLGGSGITNSRTDHLGSPRDVVARGDLWCRQGRRWDRVDRGACCC